MPELYNLCDVVVPTWQQRVTHPVADSDAPNDPILRAEKDLEQVLDALESTGIL